jgi:hypothetical protein
MSEPKYYLEYERRRLYKVAASDLILKEMAWHLFHMRNRPIDYRLAQNSEIPFSIFFLLYYRYRKDSMMRLFVRQTIAYKLQMHFMYFFNYIKFRFRFIKRSILTFFRNLW